MMKIKMKDLAVTILFIGSLAVLGIGSLFLPDTDVSSSERRHLTQFATYEEKKQEAADKDQSYGITDYFSFLESYSLDQFPARDLFRSIKAVFRMDVLFRKDNNNYYAVGGNLSKMDPEMNESVILDSVKRFQTIYKRYFENLNSNVYYCIVPDKNYFLAEQNGYLHYDYDAFYQAVAGAMSDDFTEIDIRKLLSIDHYYLTDPHWDQSKLLSVADMILLGMGSEVGTSDFDWTAHSIPSFYGTYWGQAALPVSPDTLKYLTNSQTDSITVYNYATKETTSLYKEENFNHVDPYDVFLDGAVPLLKIENPNSTTQKQLVIFRDSFGSSLIPLLTPEYAEIIVVDIRYVSPGSLSTLVRFKPKCDVLFMYSTSVLNTYGIFMS